MLSSTFLDDCLHDYGDVLLYCDVFIQRGLEDKTHNEQLMQKICALFNNGGGVMALANPDRTCYRNVCTKTLDSWWSIIERNIARLLSQDDICNYIDFVGNFDDRHFYLFVKSAEHLCTLDYRCSLPTDTAVNKVSYQSVVKLCQPKRNFESLESLPKIPLQFEYGKMEDTLKQEGKQIQFKFISQKGSGSYMAQKISKLCSKYVSAFANHEGGHIYFGIEDKTAGVYGEMISMEDEKTLVDVLVQLMNYMIWDNSKFKVEKGVHWDVHFIPVNGCPVNERRQVIVVSICKMYGGVFTPVPESYVVMRYETKISTVLGDKRQQYFTERRLNFDDWKSLLLNQSRDCLPLHSRFVKLPLLTPQCRLTFSLPHTLQSARQKVIKLRTSFNLHPQNILYSYTNQNLKQAITKLTGIFAGEEHLVISLDSWGLDHPYSSAKKPEKVLASLAVFSTVHGIHVASFVETGVTEEDVKRYPCEMSIGLKHCLVNHGGCNSRIGIKAHVVDITSPTMIQKFQEAIKVSIYPPAYCLKGQVMDDILNALTIAIASYKPFGVKQDEETDYYFLLTCDQLELLWSHQFTKELWVHGPPGAGKTVVALEMVKEFGRRGCTKDQILFVAENLLICSYVRSFDNCLVVSRRELMTDANNQNLMKTKYKQVKNVIVDEAQNFKSRDGDWYKLLETLSKQNETGEFDMTAGYFWLFMDYAQKVHKFEAGLPGLIGKNNFMLSEISRNSKEIFEYASKFMGNLSDEDKGHAAEGGDNSKAMPVEPVLGHAFSSGQDVNVLKCDKSSIHDTLFEVLKKFSQDGVEFCDMAILVSKKNECDEIKKTIKKYDLSTNTGKKPEGSSNESSDSSSSKPSILTSLYEKMSGAIYSKPEPVLVSTVRDFSGLDKSVVIGLEPHVNPDHADAEKLVLNLATRAKDSLVILTTSDDILKMLKSS